MVVTVLGSCIAVCLWDPRRAMGGMTHALLPNAPADERHSTRYADTAIGALVDAMGRLGCRDEDLRAKVFGGADLFSTPGSELAVGSRNVAVTHAELGRRGIPVVASSTSGRTGVVVRLLTSTGEVWLRRLAAPAGAPVAEQDLHAAHRG